MTGKRLTKRELTRPKQAYLHKTSVKQWEHLEDYERVGIFILESRRELEHLFGMALVKKVINSHWEPSLPNAPGKDKLWEEASPEAKRSSS